ncbi:hypothetical protein CDAR_252531 [Caerostris darwini]|uniref:Uncharacterized protein n=1 Tax=Caerostris darwini TaxID=1538125 RepID=A0AAV4WHV4_9ARAC|nr:hypothetical protein CDAR_252531 [Caerostris darwini]
MKTSEGDEKENFISIYPDTRATYNKQILDAKRQALKKIMFLLGKSFKTTVNNSLLPSEIFKATDVSESGNNKETDKKLLEKKLSRKPPRISFLSPGNYFAKDPPFTEEEIKTIQMLPKEKAPEFDDIDNQTLHFINEYFSDISHKFFIKYLQFRTFPNAFKV